VMHAATEIARNAPNNVMLAVAPSEAESLAGLIMRAVTGRRAISIGTQVIAVRVAIETAIGLAAADFLSHPFRRPCLRRNPALPIQILRLLH
jgi:hypothetical protein